MQVFERQQIEGILGHLDLLPAIEAGFVAYSQGDAVVPPVGELLLDRGEVHIKYGFLRGDESYVIKVASGFYGNQDLGLPSSNGLMLVFSQATGALQAILLDQGLLTDTRTAVAGAIAAKYLAPLDIRCIGIIGTGIQARLQLQYLRTVSDCRQALVWGRNKEKVMAYQQSMQSHGFDIRTTLDLQAVVSQCNLIVTTTPSTTPLLSGQSLQAGTHITAVGADVPGKRELDAEVMRGADVVVADSISQCRERGEIHHALKESLIDQAAVLELGAIIDGTHQGRVSQQQITVADLTGVAVQDIKIAQLVVAALGEI